MNSGGIGLLVTLLVRAQRAGQRLMAVGLSEHYRQILSLTRLDEAIEIHDTGGRGRGGRSILSPERGSTMTNLAHDDHGARDDANWAKPVDRLTVTGVDGGKDDAVSGRQVQGPLQGFGQLWQKTFKVTLTGVTITPEAAIEIWKERFTTFWPKSQRFYAPLSGIAPGEVGLLGSPRGRAPGRLSHRRPGLCTRTPSRSPS